MNAASRELLSYVSSLGTRLAEAVAVPAGQRSEKKEFEAFSFAPGIEKLEDLQVGMKLPGIVTNVTAFGAFVDIGVHQDGTGAHKPASGWICEESYGRG